MRQVTSPAAAPYNSMLLFISALIFVPPWSVAPHYISVNEELWSAADYYVTWALSIPRYESLYD